LLRPLARPLRRLHLPAKEMHRARGDAVVLVYHRVAELDHDPWRLAVSSIRFAEHLAVIARQFRPLSLDELARALEARSVPRRTVVVTFDDGYRDNLHAAKPLLEQYELPATIFVVSAYVGSTRDFWWDELEELRRRTRLAELDDRRAVWARLRELPHAQRRAELDTWWDQVGLQPPAAISVSTDEEIVALAGGELITIGAHTATHPRLPGLVPEAQLHEIRSSKARLEELLGRPVDSFSYPHGEYDRTTVACLREAGFRRACASGERAVTARTRVLEIPRLQAPDVSGDELGGFLEAHLR
jgi:peptidoglycan/xylan/chitin deacetylase (PgdA/CDA1 family)